MSAGTSRRYSPELKERAVRMFSEIRNDHESMWAAMNAVADLLGVGSGETVRKWVPPGRGRRRQPAGNDLGGVG